MGEPPGVGVGKMAKSALISIENGGMRWHNCSSQPTVKLCTGGHRSDARQSCAGTNTARILFALAGFVLSTGFVGAAVQTLHGHVPTAALTQPSLGGLEGAQVLGLGISLPLRNTDVLSNLLHDLYDPASPKYHQYLTAAEFAEQFGPTEADYQAVKDFATAKGFRITREHSNRTLLDVEAPVANIQRALHLNLRTFQHPTEGRTFYAPDAEPSFDLAVPVLAITGLDNFQLPHPMNLVLPSAKTSVAAAKPNVGTAPDGYSYLGLDFRKAYLPGIAPTLNGSGQVLGLLEFDGYYANDIAIYESLAGLPNVTLTNVLLDGFNGTPGANVLEVSLDIEMGISMAPGLDRIMVYEGTQPNDILNQMATDNLAKQISSSWTWSGYPNTPPMEQIFQQYAAQGQTYFNAAGDSGALTGAIPTPADDTNIMVVGGTTLNTDANGNWLSEKVWNWLPSQAAASSGGISQSNLLPVWQQGLATSSNFASSIHRNLPDVALTADGIFVVADNGNGYSGVGGTSAATPLWAGLTALINQEAVAAGRSTVGYLNPAVYAIGKGVGYRFLFHDIIVGKNTNASSATLFPAVPGYDLATGWGTPAGTNLIKALALAVPIVVASSAAVSGETCEPTNGAIDPGETVTVNFVLQNVGSVNTTNVVATLLTNGGVLFPSSPRTYGALLAGGTTVGQPFTFTANGSCGGAISATLQLQDGSNDLGIVSFDLPLGITIPVTNFTQNFDGVTAPALPAGWTTTHSGSDVAWVTSTTTPDTAPNAAFASENRRAGLSELISPAISVNIASAQLTFRQAYNTENGYDGGVLEIQIGGGAFTDIVAAGGSFLSNGYTAVLGNTTGNPIGGRPAWTGNSGGYITTVVNLPAAAAGQTIGLKWRFGTDSSTSGSGWRVDTISIRDGTYSCCTGSADLAVMQTVSTNPAVAGQNLIYQLTVTNLGPSTAAGVVVTDTLPAGVSFVSASPGSTFVGGTVALTVGNLAANAGTNLFVTVMPTATGAITNVANVNGTTFDAVPGNNTASLVTTVDAPPVITTQPSNAVVVAGATATLSVSVTGTPAPAFQWFGNTTNQVGGNAGVLTLTNVQPGQAGQYFVVITNTVGSTSSVPAMLTVEVPPIITAQPSNQVVVAGANVSFLVSATGIPTPGFEWLLNGTNPVAAGVTVLTLTNVSPGQMGMYTVLVTNAAGATNSIPAQLTVLVSPRLGSIQISGTNVAVSFQSVLGLNYTLQYKNNVTDASWTPATAATPGNGGTLTLYDTNGLPALRFYRVSCD